MGQPTEVEIVAARYHRDYANPSEVVEGIRLWYLAPGESESKTCEISQDSTQRNNNWHWLAWQAQNDERFCAKLGSLYTKPFPDGLNRDEALGDHETAVYTEF